MRVQVIHENSSGSKTDLGIHELDHLPPIAMPFPVEKNLYYTAKAYFGPDETGLYLLILEGEPRLAG